MPAYRTCPHLRLLPEYKSNGPKHSSCVRQSHSECHRPTDYLSRKDRRVNDPPLDWIGIDIVSTRDREPAFSIRDDPAFRVAECAADVHVG
jgi:hypothetical protein